MLSTTEIIDKDMHSSVLQLMLRALINGINQLSSSCYYVISETTTVTQPSHLRAVLDDFQRQMDQDIVKEVFSEHEWNYHVEVSVEIFMA